MRMSRWIAMAALVALIGGLLALGATSSSASTTFTNRIKENTTTHKYHYTPLAMTVHKGDTVVWKDKSDASHTVSFNNGSYSKTVHPGGSVSRTFKKTGTFKY